MPAGRKEIPIDLKVVEDAASRGLTEGQIADLIGIHQNTLILRKKKYSDFVDAIKRGQARGVDTIANALFDQALAGQTAAAIFYMKNRANWTDKQQHTGPDNGPIKTINITREMTPEEATHLYQDLIRGDGLQES